MATVGTGIPPECMTMPRQIDNSEVYRIRAASGHDVFGVGTGEPDGSVFAGVAPCSTGEQGVRVFILGKSHYDPDRIKPVHTSFTGQVIGRLNCIWGTSMVSSSLSVALLSLVTPAAVSEAAGKAYKTAVPSQRISFRPLLTATPAPDLVLQVSVNRLRSGLLLPSA